MADYRYMTASLLTGEIGSEMFLTDVSAEQSLTGGGFSAKLPMVELPQEQRERLLIDTAPAKTTVVLVRDGVCLGEWIIWKRIRQNDNSPVELTGKEFRSYLDHRLVPAMTFTQAEQFDIAAALFTDAVSGMAPNGIGSVSALVGVNPPSGIKRDRSYQQAEAFAGQRLQELSDVIDGFDWYVKIDIDNSGLTPKVVRQLMMFYPSAGRILPLSLDSAGQWSSSGAVVTSGLAEDGELFAGEAWALGGTYKDASDNDVQVIASASNTVLITKHGFPYLQISGSWTSVTEKATIKKHAQALMAAHQNSLVPAPITIRFTDEYHGPDDFMLGDHFVLRIAPSINFPNGMSIPVRITGWTIKPPGVGPETMELQVIRDVS